MDFIITSLQSWDIKIGSTIKNTAMEIAKEHRVLYINTPLDIRTYFQHYDAEEVAKNHRLSVLHGKTPPLRSVTDRLLVLDCPFTLLPVGQLPSPLFEWINRLNNHRLGQWIKKQVEKLGFRSYIHLIDNDLYRSLYLKEYLKPAVSIYYRRDQVTEFAYWRKHGKECEKRLAGKADIVLTNSELFARQLRLWNPNVHVLNTGVNLELYNPRLSYKIPEDLKPIPHPVVGYTGAILQARLDSGLMYEVACQMPDCQFVWVGPEDEHFQGHALHSLPNVHFLGYKQVTELPAYICHFDICINPQIVNPITDGNYPLKIDEYLAMGRPVVATSTHTMRQVFKDYTYLPTTVPQWITAIRQALSEAHDSAKQQARITFAHTHSWGESVKVIYQAVNHTLPLLRQSKNKPSANSSHDDSCCVTYMPSKKQFISLKND